MKHLLMSLVALCTLAIFTPSLVAGTAIAANPSPGPGYVLVEMERTGGSHPGVYDIDCGIGEFHIQDVGGVKVCTPASSIQDELTYNPDSGKWVKP